MSKRFIVCFVGVLALAALTAGCGSSGGGGESSAETTGGEEKSSGAPALSKAEFIAQGDEICEKASKASAAALAAFIKEKGLSASEEPSDEQEEELVDTVVLPHFQTEAEELGALGPPAGEEGQVEEIVEGFEEVVVEGEEDPGSVIGSDDPFADVKAKAQDFGFKVCGH